MIICSFVVTLKQTSASLHDQAVLSSLESLQITFRPFAATTSMNLLFKSDIQELRQWAPSVMNSIKEQWCMRYIVALTNKG